MRIQRWAFFFVLVWVSSQAIFATELYETQWTAILKKNTKFARRKQVSTVLVDYAGIRNSQSFPSLLRMLNNFDVSALKTDSAKKAFWINTYNIAVVKLVVEHYPTASIHTPDNDVLWKRPVIMVGDSVLTLQDIEFGKLSEFKDFRLPFALSNATLSGPDLLEEAFTEDRLNTQLSDAFKRFVTNDSKGVALNKDVKEAHFSILLKKIDDPSENQGGLNGLLQPYFKTSLDEYHVSYIYFNWDLNNK